MDAITKAQAKKQGYRAVTFACSDNEQNELNHAIQSLAKDNIPYVLVKEGKGKSLWRK